MLVLEKRAGKMIWLSILTWCIGVWMVGDLSAGELTGKTVNGCGGAAEWPPYLYFTRRDGKKSGDVDGFSSTVVNEILTIEGAVGVIELAPWRRCMREVERGVHYQILLDASTNEEREAVYHVSRPYYTMTPSYFYSKRHHPDGLPINEAGDLKSYRINGIHGYNYSDYGLRADDLEGSVDDHETLIRKLHRNRIDLFIEWVEVFGGFREIGKPFIDDPDLGHALVPNLSKTTMHLMFPRTEAGLALKLVFDKQLDALEASGRLAEILGEYVKQ